jgi:hypothetical protein
MAVESLRTLDEILSTESLDTRWEIQLRGSEKSMDVRRICDIRRKEKVRRRDGG